MKFNAIAPILLLWPWPAFAQLDFSGEVLRVDTEIVLVPVSVTDTEDRPVQGLKASEFRVWEDRIEQEIVSITTETVPASIGIIIDVSGSMESVLTEARDAAVAFLNAGHVEDEYFLLEFNDSPRVTEDFTADIGRLQNRLIHAPSSGRTALYDAVYRGIEVVKQGENPRKALLLITDGEDNRSRYSRSNIEAYIRESGVQIYALGISATFGRSTLRALTEMTGGRTVFTGRRSDLESISRELAVEMKSQYMLGYISSNPARDGGWRELRVRVEPEGDHGPITVRARRGYYAGLY